MGGKVPDASPPNSQELTSPRSSNTQETADITSRVRAVNPESREVKLIDKICGKAADVNECIKQKLPALGTVIQGLPSFPDHERFEEAKDRCLSVFPNDADMLSYCIEQIYSGLPPSEQR